MKLTQALKKKLNNEGGFTLLEMMLAIVILGFIAAALTPQFGNLMASTQDIGGKGTAGALQSAINTKYAENVANNVLPFWPNALDSAPNGVCNAFSPCFGGVAQPITNQQWHKTGPVSYEYITSTVRQAYKYEPAIGRLKCVSGC